LWTCPSKSSHSWTDKTRTDAQGNVGPDRRMGYGINSDSDDIANSGMGIGRFDGTGTVGAPLAAVVAPCCCYLAGDSRSYVASYYGDAYSDSIAAWAYAVAPAFRH